MALKNFPGVYTTVIDKSSFTTAASRFRAGLIGPAEKGPFNSPLPVRSIRDFQSKFGKGLSNSYLGVASQVIGGISDGLTVVRVGRQYVEIAASNVSGTAGAGTFFTPNYNLLTAGDYVRISQLGKPTTVNARVASVSSVAKSVTLVTTGAEAKTLAATYTAAAVDKAAGGYINDPSEQSGAASEAESFLVAPTWGSAISAAGTGTGDKNSYELTITGGITGLAVGDMLLIEQSGKNSTREIRVKSLTPASGSDLAYITFDSSDRIDIGYRALSLQDSYTAATIKKMGVSPTTVAQIYALEAGTWANSTSTKSGLSVKIFPGSAADTKRLAVYLDSGLVENFDNLTSASGTNFYETAINAASEYIVIKMLTNDHPQTTLEPTSGASTNVGLFSGGFNGENVTMEDYIGTVDPQTELGTGLKLFEDLDYTLAIDVMAAPGVTSFSVASEMNRVCGLINATFAFDTPDNLNAKQAIDWHNSVGIFSSVGKLDTKYGQLYWNWLQVTDTFTGAQRWVPPSIGALRAQAFTTDTARTWYAAAGEVRGLIPEASAVRYSKVSESSRQAFYAEGNALNPIIVNRGSIMIWGNRTTQRTVTKLQDAHAIRLTNYVVNGLSAIARKFVWEIIDDQMLASLRSQCNSFMETIRNERGFEDYSVVIDSTNNSATTRNNRNVLVDISFVPASIAERIFINATVRESGATLNNVG
jgi:phage tail sheath protein FI